jgi:thiol:disulfide interchange protein DsbD
VSATRLAARARGVVLLAVAMWPAQPVLAIGSEDDLLPPEVAFRFDARMVGPQQVEVRYRIADGYYMYRDKFRFAARTEGVSVGPAILPAGKLEDDETFGRVETYRGEVVVALPVRTPEGSGEFVLEAVSQGCADAGLCYMPQKQTARLMLATADTAGPMQTTPGGDAGVLSKLRRLAAPEPPPPEFLPVDRAFSVSVRAQDAQVLVADLAPAPGYYLYRDKTRFSVLAGAPITLGKAVLPSGERKSDPNFGDTEVWYRPVRVEIPLVVRPPGRDTVAVEMAFQGCAEAGLCYPPTTRRFDVRLAATAGTQSRPDAGPAQEPPPTPAAQQPAGAAPAAAQSAPAADADDSSRIARLLRSGNFWLIVASFFGFGVLLSFTPCVLPMVPILSGIIVGQGHRVTRGHALALSAVYVLGMAITYALAGVAAGLSGTLLSNALQNPWVLGAFALLFVVLSLSMFGFYELQLPAALQTKLSRGSNRMKGGTFWGVFAMGVLSALIVGPCVAAPLAGALLYINQSRDAMLGGWALFSLALGMGVPLMAVGASAGALVPRAGAWMQTVKNFFGVVLLGLAIWIVSPIIPAVIHMLLWAALLICSAVYLHAIDPLPHNAPGWRKLWKGIGVIALLVGVAVLVGALSGGRDLLQPLSGLRASGSSANQAGPGLRFTKVSSVADLERALQQAGGRPVMLDFYADWCVSCKEMERFTFTDPAVRARMDRMLLLKADVTGNSADDLALLKRFGLFGPPGTIFFDAQGRELVGTRVIGFQPAGRFAGVLDAVLSRS